jgi:hypothetical protein
MRIPLKERIGAKAEGIAGETEGHIPDNFIFFNSSKKRFQTGLPKYRISNVTTCHQFCSKSCFMQ